VLFACTKTTPLYMAGFVRRNEDSYEFFEKKLAAVLSLYTCRGFSTLKKRLPWKHRTCTLSTMPLMT